MLLLGQSDKRALRAWRAWCHLIRVLTHSVLDDHRTLTRPHGAVKSLRSHRAVQPVGQHPRGRLKADSLSLGFVRHSYTLRHCLHVPLAFLAFLFEAETHLSVGLARRADRFLA